MFARKVLVGLLTVLLSIPAWTSPGVVGTAAASKSATLRGNALLPGSTIFSGDIVETGADGSVAISVQGGPQVRIGSESQVRLARTGDTAQLELTRGRAAFRVTGQTPFEAHYWDATIRPGKNGAAIGFIHMTSEKKALIAAEKGSWLVSTAHDAKSITLREGEGVEVTLAPAPQAAGGTGASTLSGKWVVILGAVIIGVITVVAVSRNRDETKLSNIDKRNEVSPFRFP